MSCWDKCNKEFEGCKNGCTEDIDKDTCNLECRVNSDNCRALCS